jgi:hypothetical protein
MSRKRPKSNKAEHRAALALDRLAAFEEYEDNVLPKLREMIQNGSSAEDIYKFAAAMAAARTVTIAIKEEDSGKALSAIKDILDREQGKAKERVQHEHKYGKLRPEEVDSLILSMTGDEEEPEEEVLN